MNLLLFEPLAAAQEEDKSMVRYLHFFEKACKKAEEQPNTTVIADVSLSTFTFYLAHGGKAHR